MMRLRLWLMIIAAGMLMLNVHKVSAAEQVQFFVQLIKGTDDDVSPNKSAHKIGPKLSQKLNGVFKPKNYWEISCHQVTAKAGKPTKVSLGQQRDVQIELKNSERIITTYYKGQAAGKRICPRSAQMSLIGERRPGEGEWFVVVRLDRPEAK